MKLYICTNDEDSGLMFFGVESNAATYCNQMHALNPGTKYGYFMFDTDLHLEDENLLTDGSKMYEVTRHPDGKYQVERGWEPFIKYVGEAAYRVDEFNGSVLNYENNPLYTVSVIAHSEKEAQELAKVKIEEYIASKKPVVE